MKQKFYFSALFSLIVLSVFVPPFGQISAVDRAHPVDTKLEKDAEKITQELLPLKIKQMQNPHSLSQKDRDRISELEIALASNREARRKYAFSP